MLPDTAPLAIVAGADLTASIVEQFLAGRRLGRQAAAHPPPVMQGDSAGRLDRAPRTSPS
jgi:hypothetical protein